MSWFKKKNIAPVPVPAPVKEREPIPEPKLVVVTEYDEEAGWCNSTKMKVWSYEQLIFSDKAHMYEYTLSFSEYCKRYHIIKKATLSWERTTGYHSEREALDAACQMLKFADSWLKTAKKYNHIPTYTSLDDCKEKNELV